MGAANNSGPVLLIRAGGIKGGQCKTRCNYFVPLGLINTWYKYSGFDFLLIRAGVHEK